MSNHTSYMACHDCKETVATDAVTDVMVPPIYAADEEAEPGVVVVRQPIRAFVCRACYDLGYNPGVATPFVPFYSTP